MILCRRNNLKLRRSLILGFIVDFLGNIFGYLLWFFFDAVSNYAVAITLFALAVNLIMLPISIKRQKSLAFTSRMNAKQQELRKKYGKDPKKYQEEVALLYEKEGINPMNGCLSTMVLPLVLWSGIFGAISKPLQNALHIPSEKVSQAVSVLKADGKITSGYEQLQIVRNFNDIKDYLNVFSPEEFADIEEYSHGFDLFGINLLSNPKTSSFSEMLWVIPLLCLISTILGIYITQKLSGAQNQMEGCAKFIPYGAALFTTYVSYSMPGAVGLYWFINGVINVIQTIILNKYFNIYTINAKNEASRFAMLEIKEKDIVSLKDVDDEDKVSVGEGK